jgi:5-methyltetrahydrofolate--homocysteine methyltransferase
MTDLREVLRSGQVLLMDGAMGTELQKAGMREGECYEQWNLTHPDKVRGIHRAYVNAGARCLVTNTFQVYPAALAGHGLADQLERINEAAVENARSVCGVKHLVLASIGFCALDPEDLARMMCSLRLADAYLFETWPVPPLAQTFSLNEWHSWNPHQLPVLFSLTCSRDGQLGRVDPETLKVMVGMAVNWAHRFGVAALGVNCGQALGMDEIIQVIRAYREMTDLPLFARPNAGTPSRQGDRWVYPHTPEKMAGRLSELLEAGISMVGGCCGTTPEHIAAFRPIVHEWNARRRS